MHAIAYATPCTRSTARVLHAMRVHQVMYIFPTSGPQLLMTLTMLGDLYQFLILIAFFMVAFTASFFSLSVNAQVMIRPPRHWSATPKGDATPQLSPVYFERTQPRGMRVDLMDDDFDTSLFEKLPSIFKTLLTAELDGAPPPSRNRRPAPPSLLPRWPLLP